MQPEIAVIQVMIAELIIKFKKIIFKLVMSIFNKRKETGIIIKKGV